MSPSLEKRRSDQTGPQRTKTCRKCGDALTVGVNWTDARAKTSNNICRGCAGIYDAKYHAEHKRDRAHYHSRYHAAHRDRRVAECAAYYRANHEARVTITLNRQGLTRAYAYGWPGPADPTDLLVSTLPFYAEAYRLTRETGEKHEVDHVLPLALGGGHTPDNLQVIRKKDHHQKTKADNSAIKEMRNANRRQRRGW